MEARQTQYQVQGRQAVLTIDRPQARNALSAQVISELAESLARAENDSSVRVVVLTGAGAKTFCAGADLTTMTGDTGFLDGHEARKNYGALVLRLQSCRKPTVAKVNGHALAGGLGLVLVCDFAVASEEAEFGTPEINVGLFPMVVLALLQRHVGRKRALELILTGDRLSARTALDWGLINRVVAAGELDQAVLALVEKLGQKSQAILSLGRRAFFSAEDLPLASAVEFLATQLSINICAEDAAEGVSAFLEKRPPRWKDR